MMSETVYTTFTVPIDAFVKKQAEKILAEQGVSVDELVTNLYKTIIRTGTIPFPLATLALLSMRATEPYQLTPQEIIEIEEHADLHGWVAPFTQEDHDSFAHFFSVFKRYNIVPSKATKLEYEFVMAMTEGELYANRSAPKATSERISND